MLNSLSTEELQFIKAIEKYKATNGKLFLSWTEVLKIAKDMGYRKTAAPRETPPKPSTKTKSAAKTAPKAASKAAPKDGPKSVTKATEQV